MARAFKAGILTSATIMANGDAFEDAVEVARSSQGLGIGCHLSAVGGRPVASPRHVDSLLDSGGMLPATLGQLMIKLARGQVRSLDIEHEFRAQVERVVAAGIRPTHLDSHKHTHTHPHVMRALARVAREFAIGAVRNPFESIIAPVQAGATARAKPTVYLKQYALSAAISLRAPSFKRLAREYGLRTPDHFFGLRLTGLLDAEAIRSLIKSSKQGTTELMCHPAVYDDELERARTRLKRAREQELEALTDPSVRRLIDEQGIKLVSYRELG